ncbi:endonuclease domain-containing protein [Mucilaginibacter sp. Bleaf8]|uniref:endonuclease domain-containing protein n=1 Tax=Mucilaginibacter sp. Bleaf8 TaxID=2834430 RepID=UPI001BD0FF0F|nr:endonuclease domain-containing protein [Mucilaginibacter sp. Bleaf8]MBS7564218.1 endonuclease domain-containing protein [Mucilaginibacter sp. Bleaf8]
MELVSLIREKPLPNPPREGGLQEPHQAGGYRENANPLSYEVLKGNSKANRHSPTPAENLLWEQLRHNSTGYKIRRQHVIDNYITDFVCLQKGLVIEVDGGYHQNTIEADNTRTEMLNHWGFEVVRFSNDEVLQSPQNVFETIKQKIESMPDREKALPTGEGLGGASI